MGGEGIRLSGRRPGEHEIDGLGEACPPTSRERRHQEDQIEEPAWAGHTGPSSSMLTSLSWEIDRASHRPPQRDAARFSFEQAGQRP